MNNKINSSFENSFISRSLENEIILCDNYELIPLFRKYLPQNQPILEAGCGGGRWVVWFTKQGWKSTGIDWSLATTNKAKELYPGCSFISGDIRTMSFSDKSFKSIIALGTIEHDPDGPYKALKEFFRVLAVDGIVIITVPYGSLIYRIIRPFESLKQYLLGSNILRKIFNKYLIQNNNSKRIKSQTNSKWCPIFSYDNDGWFFYEYRFNKRQMKRFLLDSGFNLVQESVTFKEDGIFLNFGRLAGFWDYDNGKVQFNYLGKVLNYILPNNLVGGHLCYVINKPSS